MGFGHNQRGSQPRDVRPARGRTVVSEDYSRFLQPGEPEVGWVARDGPDPARLLRRRRRHPQDLPRGRGAAGGGLRRPRHRWKPTARCGCSAATRWWSTPAGRRCSSRRSRRCCARIPASPTRWWSAGRANGGARRSSRWSQLRAGCRRRPRDALHAHCTSQLARFKAPKEFIFVEQVRRLGNGKADYRWAKSRSDSNRSRLDMTCTKAIDCLVNVHFGETEKQPDVDAQGARRLLQGPGVDVRAGRPVRAARRDGRAGRRARPS